MEIPHFKAMADIFHSDFIDGAFKPAPPCNFPDAAIYADGNYLNYNILYE